MAKDVEYWQGEFDHWHKQATDMADKYNELLNKQDQKNWIKELYKVLYSLNVSL